MHDIFYRLYNIVVYETIDWRHYIYMSILHFVTCTKCGIIIFLAFSFCILAILLITTFEFPLLDEKFPMAERKRAFEMLQAERWKQFLHYENTLIQIYRYFHLQKLKIFR